MKFFEKLMIDEYNEWLNEGDDFGDMDAVVLKRMYYKKIMNSDKSQLDKMFKDFEKRQEQWRKRQRFGFSDDQIDLLKSWFDKRVKQLGIKESYSFESLNEAPIKSKGWDKSSLEKFGKTIGKDPQEKGFFDACVTRMKGKDGFDEEKAKGFCASIKDAAYGSPNWRGKDKTKSQAKKDTADKEYKKK